MFEHEGNEYHLGWRYDPAAVEAVLATLPTPIFSSAGTALAGAGDDKNVEVLFWELEQKFLGHLMPVYDQGQVGSCVGNGWARACQDLLAIQIALGNLAEMPELGLSSEFTYGLSREIGNDLSRTDGSVGAWAGQSVKDYGVLARMKYDAVDLSTYSAQRCKDWGLHGVPAALKDVAKQHPVKAISKVEDVSTMADLLANLHPIAVCGPWNYTMKRDSSGCCPRNAKSGGGHCRMKCGVFWTKGGSKAYGSDGAGPDYAGAFRVIPERNSWGDYLGRENEKVTTYSGREITYPPGVFGTRDEDHKQDLSQGDTFGVGNATDWVAQNLPNYI